MTLDEAMTEVWEVAKTPRRIPPDASVIEMGGVELVDFMANHPVHAQVAHENLSPAQETVCRWVWDTMARHLKAFEPFEAGFLYDYNVDHELTVWVRMALVFEEFCKRHPSADKRQVVESLCHLSCGLPPIMLTRKRAKELIDLWNGKGMDDGATQPEQ
jgi:hypothetical protein